MKKISLLMLPILIIILIRCGGGEGVSAVKTWTGKNDISDFQAYEGIAGGGVIPITYKPDVNGNIDSSRNAFFARKMTAYDEQLFQYITIEFYEDKVTFVDSTGNYKIVSNYHFKGDSLFVIKSGNRDAFIAQGTTDTLYRRKSYARYKSPKTGNDTVTYHNSALDLETVAKAAGFSGSNAMDKGDTIIWLNARYIFK